MNNQPVTYILRPLPGGKPVRDSIAKRLVVQVNRRTDDGTHVLGTMNALYIKTRHGWRVNLGSLRFDTPTSPSRTPAEKQRYVERTPDTTLRTLKETVRLHVRSHLDAPKTIAFYNTLNRIETVIQP